MLRALRDGAKSGFLKYILMGLLVLAGGGLVFTDVGGFFSGGVSNNLVAKGKNIKISTVQFDKIVRRILARQGMTPEEAYNLGYINQILGGQIQTQILTREAQSLGINVSDEVVMEQVSEVASNFERDDLSKKDALTQVLRSQGISEAEFIAGIRQEMGNTLLRNSMVSGAETISKAQATDLYQYQNEERNARGFILRNKDAKLVTEPTDENIQKYYEANKSDFLISEKRDVTIAALNKDMLADKVTISEDTLRAAYEENISTYEMPERRKLQQAILDRQTDAQDIVERINKGKSLKDSVKRVTGNNSPYLGENDFEKGGLLEEISKPVFEAQENAVIGPIQTALGWHVLVLKDILEPTTKDFEKVKDALKDELLQEALLEDLIETANTIDDRLASGEALDSVVSELSLSTQKFSNFNQAGINEKGKDLFGQYQGDRAPILEAAFDFEQGESSPIMELTDGSFVTVHVDSITEKSYQPLDNVKEQLKARWIAEQKNLSNKQRADEAIAAIQDGKSLEETAKKFDMTVSSFDGLKRAQAPKSPITLPALRKLYEAPKDKILKIAIKDGYMIAEVTEINLPSVEKADKEIEKIMKQTAQTLSQETMAQYINSLSNKYKVEINDRVLKQIYGTPAQE